MIIIDASGTFRMADERRCRHCGCWTNAKLRRCCPKGEAEDRRHRAQARTRAVLRRPHHWEPT